MIARIIILVISSIFVILEGNQVNGLRCYVCSEDGAHPCTNFELNEHEFIQECKPSDKGCFRETNGGKKTRSCNPQGIDDCKTANGVEYCFCSTDLCNGIGGKFVNPTDDEDLLEGSGVRLLSPVSDKKGLAKPSSSNMLSRGLYLYFATILIFFRIY